MKKLCLVVSVIALPMMGQESLGVDCRALLAKGDAQGAIQKALGAVQHDPSAALPHGVLAETLLASLPWTKPETAAKFRQGARTEAQKALAIDPVQAEALETMRIVEGRAHGVAEHVPGPVMTRVDQAEALLRSGHADQAGSAFEEIAKAVPGVSGIDSYSGDAWMAASKIESAVMAYQRAVTEDSESGPAYRGLGLAHAAQGDLDASRKMLEMAIQLDPLDSHAWDAYEAVEKRNGRTLTHLTLPPWILQKSLVMDPDGWMREVPQDRTDRKFWESYRTSVWVDYQLFRRGTHDSVGRRIASSEFGVEAEAWVSAIKGLPPTDDPTWDPLVAWMRKFDRNDQLYPAVFLLFFVDRWKGEYRAWLKSNPGAVEKFLKAYPVRPEFPK